MKKFISLFLVVLTFVLFAIPCFASTEFNSPSGDILNSSQYYLIYKRPDGTMRMLVSNQVFYFLKHPTAPVGDEFHFISNNPVGLSSDSMITTSNITFDLNGGKYYSYNATTGLWETLTLAYTTGIKLSTDNTGGSSFFEPIEYYANFDVKTVSRTGVQTLLFPQTPVVPSTLTEIVHQAGGQVLQGASATSSIVLGVGLLILAILLGVSLIPRVLSLFL